MLLECNPFLLLQHLEELNKEEIKDLTGELKLHLDNLKQGAAAGTFSGEQLAEIKVWLTKLGTHLAKLGLDRELKELYPLL